MYAKSNIDDYKEYLNQSNLIRQAHKPFYIKWVGMYLEYTGGNDHRNTHNDENLKNFTHELSKTERYQDWQIDQAIDAINLFSIFLRSKEEPKSHLSLDYLIEKTLEIIRLRHYSEKTGKSYINWIKQFYNFSQKEANEFSSVDVKSFLSYLAENKKVATSTQNQAFNAILFLFFFFAGLVIYYFPDIFFFNIYNQISP